MSNKIGVAAATLLAVGSIGFAGMATAVASPASESARVQCPHACLDIYRPVTCLMSDGSVLTFGNRCYADVYACQHRLTIIGCWPGDVS